MSARGRRNGDDSIIYLGMTDKAYENSCKENNAVQLIVYSELDHSAVVRTFAPE